MRGTLSTTYGLAASRLGRGVALLFCMSILLSACGKPNKVGSEKLLDIKQDEKGACRLGQNCPTPEAQSTASPEANVLGKPTSPPPPPPPQAQFYEISLTSTEGSWYHDEAKKEDITCLAITVGTNLRVTNKDSEPNRPTRTFTATNGDFDSGPLKLGERWTHKFERAGEWQVQSKGAPFIILNLKVGVACN